MKVAGSIALVTGANRGLGLAFAKVLVEMGAAKVYAAARNPEAVTLKGVAPLKLDVTSDEDAVAAARVAGNVNLLVNNAGIARPGGFLADGAVEAAREQFEVNFVGPLRMARAFAPVLAKNGGGAIINVLSVTSWMNGPTKLGRWTGELETLLATNAAKPGREQLTLIRISEQPFQQPSDQHLRQLGAAMCRASPRPKAMPSPLRGQARMGSPNECRARAERQTRQACFRSAIPNCPTERAGG